MTASQQRMRPGKKAVCTVARVMLGRAIVAIPHGTCDHGRGACPIGPASVRRAIVAKAWDVSIVDEKPRAWYLIVPPDAH
jgi:hypothetical protein